MLMITLILLVIGLFVGLITLKLFWQKKKEGGFGEEIYQTLFILGISITTVGIVLMTTTGNPMLGGIIIIGFIYLTINLANRKNDTGNKIIGDTYGKQKHCNYIFMDFCDNRSVWGSIDRQARGWFHPPFPVLHCFNILHSLSFCRIRK